MHTAHVPRHVTRMLNENFMEFSSFLKRETKRAGAKFSCAGGAPGELCAYSRSEWKEAHVTHFLLMSSMVQIQALTSLKNSEC